MSWCLVAYSFIEFYKLSFFIVDSDWTGRQPRPSLRALGSICRTATAGTKTNTAEIIKLRGTCLESYQPTRMGHFMPRLYLKSSKGRIKQCNLVCMTSPVLCLTFMLPSMDVGELPPVPRFFSLQSGKISWANEEVIRNVSSWHQVKE